MLPKGHDGVSSWIYISAIAVSINASLYKIIL